MKLCSKADARKKVPRAWSGSVASRRRLLAHMVLLLADGGRCFGRGYSRNGNQADVAAPGVHGLLVGLPGSCVLPGLSPTAMRDDELSPADPAWATFRGVVHGRIHCNAAHDSILEQLGDLLGFMTGDRMTRRTLLQGIPSLAFAGVSHLVAAAPELHDLRLIDDFKKLFNADKGQPRIVLLLSPT